MCMVLKSSFLASSMKYSGTVVTDIRLGSVRYYNATVTLTFFGDTKDIKIATRCEGKSDPEHPRQWLQRDRLVLRAFERESGSSDYVETQDESRPSRFGSDICGTRHLQRGNRVRLLPRIQGPTACLSHGLYERH